MNKSIVQSPSSSNAVPAVAREFQSTAKALEDEEAPAATAWVLYALAAFFIGSVIWASIASVDEVVPVRGSLVSSVPVVVVQPMELAVIRSISVRAGDIVHKGDVLATLDPTFANADVTQLEKELASLTARQARLETEVGNKETFTPPSESEAGYLELSLFQQRKQQFDDRLKAYDEDLAGAAAKTVSIKEDMITVLARIDLLQETVDVYQTLTDKQLGSRLALLNSKADLLAASREQAQMLAQIIDLKHQAESTEAQRNAYIHDWHEKVLNDLVAVRNEIDRSEKDLNKAELRREKTRLIAPIDSVVLEVAKRSTGSVLQGAETLFALVPLDAPLEAEALILSDDIGHISIGDRVKIKIDAFPFQKYGVLEGKIKTISADVFLPNNSDAAAQAANAASYYKARIALEDILLPIEPEGFRLLPGMSVIADVHVGTRKVISYMLYPILRGLNEAAREP